MPECVGSIWSAKKRKEKKDVTFGSLYESLTKNNEIFELFESLSRWGPLIHTSEGTDIKPEGLELIETRSHDSRVGKNDFAFRTPT